MTTVNATDVIDGNKNQHEINNVTMAHGFAHWRDLREFGNAIADQTTDHTTLILNTLSQLSEGETLYIPRNVKWNATTNPNAVYNAMKDNCVLIDDSGYENRYGIKYWQASQQIYYKTKDYGSVGRANGNGLNLRSNYHHYLNFEIDTPADTGGCKASVLWRFNNELPDTVQFGANGIDRTKAHLGVATHAKGDIPSATALKLGLRSSIAPHCWAFNSDLIQDMSYVFGKRQIRTLQGVPEDDDTWMLSNHSIRWSQPTGHKGNFEQTWVVPGYGTLFQQVIEYTSGNLIWTLKGSKSLTLNTKGAFLGLTKNVITPVTTYNLSEDHSGSFISNISATSGYVANLPKAIKGLFFEFSVDSVNNLRVQPNIADNFLSFAVGKYKQSNTLGSRLRVIAVTDNIWSVEQTGTWTDQT
ncbi:hypothetical protein [Acinetobacter dispersus]|uniref:hypothetical protein n=1 Tax=Acinetobacter dispersus TaxID=70348 RepID=UPI0021CD98DE|nr:hypothetical protein [Acinetobacter dispersus]MCU4336078.1 hypothetical protein [Acinetobacter dispersus]